jgi:serine/threonine protein kinase
MTHKANNPRFGDAATARAWERCEATIEAFERAWQEEQRPQIDDFLSGEGSDPAALLVELVHVDLEFRLKAGETARVESYLRRYPVLNSDSAIVLELLGTEHALRQRHGVGVDLDEYALRFPEYIEELRRRMAGNAPLPLRTSDLDKIAQAADLPIVPGYEIREEIGRGGMGVVYRAQQLGLERTVALKMILTGVQAGAKNLTRFRAEAAALARMQHPNIVQIYDVGEVSGRPYFVFEFVAGGSLAQYLRGTPQSVRPAAELMETLARAIHAAHTNGVIHRDLKPANILLRDEVGDRAPLANRLATLVPKITDFGLAKYVGSGSQAPSAHGLTVTGEMLGTPNYMAPEQAIARHQPVDPTADIYSLGAILYELLTGRPPFTGETPLTTVLQVLNNEPVCVTELQPNVPRDLETICLKCLRKEPRQRYGSALDLAEDLQRFLREEPIKARPVGIMEKTWRWIRSHPLPTILLAAGLLAPVLALVTLSFLSTRLVRSNALESAAQQAELLEEATKEYSRNVQEVIKADYPVNKMVPPTPGTVPLRIPATFLHDIGEQLARTGRSGVKVRQYSDLPFPWRTGGGPRDAFENEALRRLRQSKGQETVHEFTEIGGERVVRYAQARVMQRSCVECHNTHPKSPKKDWQVGDVRGVLEIIRPLDKDEARVGDALRLALLISTVTSGLFLGGGVVVASAGRRRSPTAWRET